MTKTKFVFSTFLILVSMWWGWTVLVDIFIIPTVFRQIDNFFQAGNLGIAVFSRLNNLELIVSSVLVALFSFQTLKNKKAWPLFSLALVLWLIALTYFTYLTPMIIDLTEKWQLNEIAPGTPDIQNEHQFFHNLYIRLDAVKLFLLTALMVLGIYKSEKWT